MSNKIVSIILTVVAVLMSLGYILYRYDPGLFSFNSERTGPNVREPVNGDLINTNTNSPSSRDSVINDYNTFSARSGSIYSDILRDFESLRKAVDQTIRMQAQGQHAGYEKNPIKSLNASIVNNWTRIQDNGPNTQELLRVVSGDLKAWGILVSASEKADEWISGKHKDLDMLRELDQSIQEYNVISDANQSNWSAFLLQYGLK